MKMDYEVGDMVTWKSHGIGHWKTKTGRIVAIIQPGMPFCSANLPYHQWNVNIRGTSRLCRSYLVLCDVPGKRGARKPQLYWPFPNVLETVEEVEKDKKHAAPICDDPGSNRLSDRYNRV